MAIFVLTCQARDRAEAPQATSSRRLGRRDDGAWTARLVSALVGGMRNAGGALGSGAAPFSPPSPLFLPSPLSSSRELRRHVVRGEHEGGGETGERGAVRTVSKEGGGGSKHTALARRLKDTLFRTRPFFMPRFISSVPSVPLAHFFCVIAPAQFCFPAQRFTFV